MLDLRRQKNEKPAVAVATGMSARDKILLLSVFTCLMVVIIAIIKIDKHNQTVARSGDSSPALRTPLAMSVPDLAVAKLLPSAEDSSAWASNTQWLIDNPQELTNHLNGFTGKCFSWWKKQYLIDEQVLPRPEFFPASDIASGALEFGTTILTSGLLVATVEAEVAGDVSWQWMTLELPHHQFILLIVPSSEKNYIIGEKIRVLGRFLSTTTLPGGKSGERIVVIGARHVSTDLEDGAKEIPLFGVSPLVEKINEFTHDDEKELWTEINDQNPILELRPYYYMLAKVAMKDGFDDRVYDNAQNANVMSAILHNRPQDFRDQIFTVEGKVLESFVDEGVAADSPYGISEVTRIIMWLHIYGEYKEQDITGKVTSSQKLVAHSYELAVVGKLKAPKKGQRIRARGRFLKVHGMPMDRSSNRDAVFGQSQSMNYYSKMFIVRDFEVIEDDQEVAAFGVITAAVLASFILCMVYLFVRDGKKGIVRQKESHRKRSERRIRKVSAQQAQAQSTSSSSEVSSDSD